MRAKLINEKFTEDSDPIKDMDIGIPPIFYDITLIEDEFFETIGEIDYKLILNEDINKSKFTINLNFGIDDFGDFSGYLNIFLDFANNKGTVKVNVKNLNSRKKYIDEDEEDISWFSNIQDVYDHVETIIDRLDDFMRD